MKVSVISCNSKRHEVLVVAGALTANHLHKVAEAFIDKAMLDDLGKKIVKVFGQWRYKSYVLDYSSRQRARITFSMRAKPDLLYYKGGPTIIHANHAADLEVFVDTLEMTALSKVVPGGHLYDAGVTDG